MKRSRLIIPLIALATMALMLSATGATAEPHETLGEPHTECSVNGVFEWTDGLDNIPGSNHYVFPATSLECFLGKDDGTYSFVAIEGDTADFWHQLNNSAEIGEDCEQGGSITTDQPDVHSGVLSAQEVSGSGSPDKAGLMHFVRLGNVMLADGPLWDGSTELPDKPRPEPDQWFQAELVLTPEVATCTKEDPIRMAAVDGTIELYPDWIHFCEGDEDTENAKGHCDDI